MADFALELSFDDESERAIVEQWRALRAAGLPSQADHRVMTNAPHLTLVVAREIPSRVVDTAREALAPLLPVSLELRGRVVFGSGSRVTLAHLAEPPREVADHVARLRAETPALRHAVWTPHITLGRRIPRERIGEAFDVLDGVASQEHLRTLRANRLRWWRPDAGTIDLLASI